MLHYQANNQKALALCLAAAAVLAPVLHADAAPMPGYKLPEGYIERNGQRIIFDTTPKDENGNYAIFAIEEGKYCFRTWTPSSQSHDCTPYRDLRGSLKIQFDILDTIYNGSKAINPLPADKIPAQFKKQPPKAKPGIMIVH